MVENSRRVRLFAVVMTIAGCLATRAVVAHPVSVNPERLASAESVSTERERANLHIHPGSDLTVYTIPPKATNPLVSRFLKNDYVMYLRSASPQANLLVFMPGTFGQPANVQFSLATAAAAGYRAIGLEYNDVPAVAQACESDRDTTCSQRFREKRIYVNGVAEDIDDTPDESILNRLTTLLIYLSVAHPKDGWDGYLEDGVPKWSRIAVSGHSQGAGMAAFIAKRVAVARVVLISSPWDFYGSHVLAPWLTSPSATPAGRWYGLYHRKERQAATIARAYTALGLDASHVRVLDGEPRRQTEEGDPYHMSMVGDGLTPLDDGRPAYTDDWLFALGKSP